eukprot:TRINITY_DN2131_c0_g1_i1.p1 TRINITY_DN2131_c0_g1~~TRINITY_DN2131_c0_g1_i1.p1  ORF type:complete len:161 (-),score=20.45 TRINITY_DN2131_c0_g1_i1:745-1227(-)
MDGQSLGALLLLLICLSSTTAQMAMAATWLPCGEDGVPVTVKGVVMTPDPPVRGSGFAFDLPASSNREIAGGFVNVYVYFHGILVHSEKDDLCDKTSCPVHVGDFVFRNKQDLPWFTPPGPYMVRLMAYDEDRESLFCAEIKFRIRFRAFLKRQRLQDIL